MDILTLPLGQIGANCYLISTEKALVAIDIGAESGALFSHFEKAKQNLKQMLILLTHSHFDHIAAAADLRRRFGAKIAIGKGDMQGLCDPAYNLSALFGQKCEPFYADIALNDGQTISCADLEFKVLETSGHTIGGVCYLLQDKLFSGDTLFFESIGRTDFYGGNYESLCKSIKKLYLLPENTTVYPGHGEITTIGHEKNNNPYVRG